MPTVRMPDGAQVNFPDNMPPDEIRSMIQKKFPNTDFTGADPGFWTGTGRALRGVATGVGSVIEEMDPYMPTGPYIKPEEQALIRHPPKDPVEKGGVFGGQVLSTLAVPSLGIEGGLGRVALKVMRSGQRYLPKSELAAKSIPKVEKVIRGAEPLLEGGTRGAVAGALMPGDDRATDAEVGAAVGGGVRGAGTAAASAVGALPPKIKNTISALAALATANKFGMPWWMALPHMGLDQSSGQYVPGVINQVYNANLADLAAKYFSGLTRSNPAALGAAGVKLKQGTEVQ